MKFVILAIVVLSACVSAFPRTPLWTNSSTWPTFPNHTTQSQRSRRELTGSIGAVKIPGRRWDPTVQIQGHWRFRREADPQGSVSGTIVKPLSGPERRPTVNLDYQHKIYEGRQGSISASGGVAKYPGHRVEPTIGLQGQWRFRREANPQGSISGTIIKPLSGPERRPTVNLDYQHKIYEGRQGSISASGGVSKFPGRRVEPTIGLQGQWRFRREADPQGSVSGGIGVVKIPGRRWDPTVQIQGQWRFRREADGFADELDFLPGVEEERRLVDDSELLSEV